MRTGWHATGVARGSGGGPKSSKGKAIVRRNPLRNGLRSQQLIIPHVEEERDWKALVTGVANELRPNGAMQGEFIEHIAFQLWVLRRVRRATNAEVLKSLVDMPSMYEPSARLSGRDIRGDTEADAAEFQREAERRLVPSEKAMERSVRYEAHAVRTLQKLLAEYRALPSERTDETPGKTWIEVRKAEE